jgi:hypothetical protein
MSNLADAIAKLPTDREIMRVYYDPVNLPRHSVKTILMKRNVLDPAIALEVLVLGQYGSAAEAEEVARGVSQHLAIVKRLTS